MKQFLILSILTMSVAQAAPAIPQNRWAIFRMTFQIGMLPRAMTPSQNSWWPFYEPVETWYFRNLSPAHGIPHVITYIPGSGATFLFSGTPNSVVQFFHQNLLPPGHPVRINYGRLVQIPDPNNMLRGFIRQATASLDDESNDRFHFMQLIHRIYPNLEYGQVEIILPHYERLLRLYIALAPNYAIETVRNRFRLELRHIGIDVPQHPEEQFSEFLGQNTISPDFGSNDRFRLMIFLSQVYPDYVRDIQWITDHYAELLQRFIGIEALGADPLAVRNRFRQELRGMGLSLPRHQEEQAPRQLRARRGTAISGGGS
jgi:hypothetical protein